MSAWTPEGRRYEQEREAEAKVRATVQCMRRARRLLVELETLRTSADINRVRHGVMHELETALTLLGTPLEWPSEVKPRLPDKWPPELAAMWGLDQAKEQEEIPGLVEVDVVGPNDTP